MALRKTPEQQFQNNLQVKLTSNIFKWDRWVHLANRRTRILIMYSDENNNNNSDNIFILNNSGNSALNIVVWPHSDHDLVIRLSLWCSGNKNKKSQVELWIEKLW